MAVREASSALTLNSIFRLYRDVWDFALAPSPARATLAFGPIFLIALGALFVLDLSLATGSIYLESAIASGIGHDFPDPIVEDYSFAEDFTWMILLAPVIEEALFRGWLKGDIAALRFAAISWVALLMLVAGVFVSDTLLGALTIVSLILLLGGFSQWLVTRQRDTQVPWWFEAHFGKIVWGSTLAFGLLHLGNFEALNGPLDLMIISSQTVGGLVLAYTRTRLGLPAAIAQHAAFNLLILLEVSAAG